MMFNPSELYTKILGILGFIVAMALTVFSIKKGAKDEVKLDQAEDSLEKVIVKQEIKDEISNDSDDDSIKRLLE